VAAAARVPVVREQAARAPAGPVARQRLAMQPAALAGMAEPAAMVAMQSLVKPLVATAEMPAPMLKSSKSIHLPMHPAATAETQPPALLLAAGLALPAPAVTGRMPPRATLRPTAAPEPAQMALAGSAPEGREARRRGTPPVVRPSAEPPPLARPLVG
jgi:hypothetical protein